MVDKIQYSIPFIRDLETLERVITYSKESEHSEIVEMYGGLSDVRELGSDEFKKIASYAKSNGLEFALTITIRDGNEDKEDLDEILKEGIPDKLIVSSKKDIEKYHDDFKIYLSTIFGFQSERDIEKVLKLKNKYPLITDLCFHHDSTRDQNLKDKALPLAEAGIDTKVLITESCYERCIQRKAHYNKTVHQEPDVLQHHCVATAYENPARLLDLSGFLMPEEISQFQKETGISTFKISGRGRGVTPEQQGKIITSYLNFKSPENLYDLIIFTYAKDHFHVSSERLLQHCESINKLFYQTTTKERDAIAQSMIAEGSLKILQDQSPGNQALAYQARKLYAPRGIYKIPQ